ncbi:MAG: Na+/H+ antiporter subunit G [Sphingomonadales bacterium]
MNLAAEILVSLLLVVGGLFALVGSFGMLKLPSLMARLHAPTKATTVGVGGCLLGSMGYFALTEGRLSVHELGITLFLFLTAPVTANMIAKAYLHRNLPKEPDLPPTGGAAGWATIDGINDPGEPR